MTEKPRPVGGVVREGFALWAQNAMTLWPVLVPLALVSQIASVIAITAAAPTGSTVVNGVIYVPFGSATGPIRTAHLAVLALTALIGVLAAGVALRIFTGDGSGSPVGGRAAFSFARSRFGGLLWLGILYAAVIAGGSLLLILPGIYILIACTAAFPVFAAEDLRGLRALGRARQLCKGRWWATLGAVLPSWVLVGGGTALITFVLRVNGSVSCYALAEAFGGFVIQVLLVPIATATTVAVYRDLRARREPMPTNTVGRAIIAPLVSPPPSGGDIWWS